MLRHSGKIGMFFDFIRAGASDYYTKLLNALWLYQKMCCQGAVLNLGNLMILNARLFFPTPF